MKYLIIDGMAFGTGVRNGVEGGFIDIEEFDISETLSKKLKQWLLEYEDEHYNGYADPININKLDNKGIEIAKLFRSELKDCKVEYYSNGKTKMIKL